MVDRDRPGGVATDQVRPIRQDTRVTRDDGTPRREPRVTAIHGEVATERIPERVNRPDEPRLPGLVVDGPANFGHDVGEARIGNMGLGPDDAENLVLRHGGRGTSHQQHEQREGFWREMDDVAIAEQLPRGLVEHAPAELPPHVGKACGNRLPGVRISDGVDMHHCVVDAAPLCHPPRTSLHPIPLFLDILRIFNDSRARLVDRQLGLTGGGDLANYLVSSATRIG